MRGVLRLLAVLLVTSPLAPAALAQDPGDLIHEPTNEDGFQVVASSGFGDKLNSAASSMQWFKGDLYVGTTRAGQCVTLATVGSQLPVDVYPFLAATCPFDPADLDLAAEIWRYSPPSGRWDRVYRSPVNVPIRAGRFTARDIAYRAMTVVKEAGGQTALYVGGMTAADLFPKGFDRAGYPPRILRTSDGSTWQALPQAVGSFLGNLGSGIPGSQIKPVVFDALVGSGGRLFATAGDSLGNDAVLVSSNPASGNDGWQLASPAPEAFPVSAVAVYNGFLYCAVAGRQGSPYRIFKADAGGAAPLSFSLVLTGGDSASASAFRAVALTEFNGRLYVGTGTPPELVRLDADDSWDLIVGEPRLTEAGLKRPLGGVSLGLGSAFALQFRTLTAHDGKLYLGTTDWSELLDVFAPLGDVAQLEFGFDLFRSADGVSFTPISRNGLGVDHQPIVQTMASTPAGLFVGSASWTAGAEVWSASSAAAASADAMSPPARVEAVSEELVDQSVVLAWEPVSGATQYRVYRATVVPVMDILSGVTGAPLDGGPVADLLQGVCDAVPLVCALVGALQSGFGIPGPFVAITATPDTFLVDERASTLPALYFVQAEGDGGLSTVSNMAGGPSRAAFISFTGVSSRLDAANHARPARARLRIAKFLRRAQLAAQQGGFDSSRRLLAAAEKGLKQGPVVQRVSATEAQDLAYFFQGLRRNVWLAGQDLIPLDAVLQGVP